jgi:hypothetical protein
MEGKKMTISKDRENELMGQYALNNFMGTEADRQAFFGSLTSDERIFMETALHAIASAWLRNWRDTIRQYVVRDIGEREYRELLHADEVAAE